MNSAFGEQELTLGKYQLIAELGHGGMSDVYLAVIRAAAGFEKLVVLKVLRQNLAEDVEFRELFINEARLAARLSHRNVVQTYEVGEDKGHHYIVMEYLEGQPFKRVLEKAQLSRDRRLCIRILADALAGLHHAHELRKEDGSPLGVVHRDVSPHNMFVTHEGLTKVVDFGIAKALDASTETSAGVMKGKIAYVAPEQAASRRVDRRADVFSAGVVLYHIVTGKRMWQGMRAGRISRQLLTGDIPKLSHEDGYDRNLVRIVNRALEVRPQDRFASAELFRRELMAYLEQTGGAPDERKVGAWISELFRDDRMLMEAIVRRQFARLREERTGKPVAIARLVSQARSADATFPLESSSPSGTGPLDQTSSLPSNRDGSLRESRTYSAVASSNGVGSQKSVVFLGVAVGLLIGLLASLAWFWAMTSSAAAPHTAGAPSGPGTEGVGRNEGVWGGRNEKVEARKPSSVSVWITSIPDKATLELDGLQVGKTPYHATVPVDAKGHWVKISAPGYLPLSRKLRFNKDIRMEIVLKKEMKMVSAYRQVPDHGNPKPVHSTPASSPVSTQKSKPTRPSRQPLDTDDPWAP